MPVRLVCRYLGSDRARPVLVWSAFAPPQRDVVEHATVAVIENRDMFLVHERTISQALRVAAYGLHLPDVIVQVHTFTPRPFVHVCYERGVWTEHHPGPTTMYSPEVEA